MKREDYIFWRRENLKWCRHYRKRGDIEFVSAGQQNLLNLRGLYYGKNA